MTAWQQQSLWERFTQTRQKQMQQEKDPYLGQMQDIVEYLRPDLTGDSVAEGQFSGTSIIEGSGHFAAETMANWFVGNMVGPHLKWIRHRMAQRKFRGDDVFNAFLQRVSAYMLEDVYPKPRSNFYDVNASFVLDGLTVGSPVMLIDEDVEKRRNVCIVPHYTENYLMRDWFGDDIVYHRKWKVSNLAAMQAFGSENLPFSIQSQTRVGDFTAKNDYLMCIARAGDPIFQDLQPEHQIPITRPWMVLWFSLNAATIEERWPLNYRRELQPDGSMLNFPTSSPGWWTKPFHAWHYKRLPHETYSRTPAWSAIFDVKGHNAAWRTIHEVAHKFARPSMYALEALKHKIRLGAGGITWVDDVQYDRPPKPVEDRANYNFAMDFVDRRAKSVDRHFFVDIARMIDSYSRDHTQPPTAFQLAQMLSEKMVLVGPAITTYAGGHLSEIDDHFMDIELQKGKVRDVTASRFWRETEPPDEIFETSGELTPILTGPLAQSLIHSTIIKQIQDPLSVADYVFQQWPHSKHKIKPGVLVEHILESGDFLQDAIRSEEEYDEIQEAIATQQRQDQMLERASVMADIVPKLQGESLENSPLKQLSEVA